jgi:hypothetical protein
MTKFFLGALHNGEYVSPYNAEKGRRYTCLCGCGGPLIFRKGEINVPHFAYPPGERHCDFSYDHPGEGEVHKMVKHIIADLLRKKKIKKVVRSCPKGCTYDVEIDYEEGDEVIHEYRVSEKCIVDVALINNGKIKYIFEVYNTHKTTRETPEPWFEIDANKFLKDTENGTKLTENVEYSLNVDEMTHLQIIEELDERGVDLGGTFYEKCDRLENARKSNTLKIKDVHCVRMGKYCRICTNREEWKLQEEENRKRIRHEEELESERRRIESKIEREREESVRIKKYRSNIKIFDIYEDRLIPNMSNLEQSRERLKQMKNAIIRSDEYHKLGDNAQSTNENWLNELPITKREKIKKQLEHEPIEAKRMKLVLDAVKTDSTKKRKYTRERVLASQSNMKSALIGLCEYNGCLIILFDADVFTNNSFQLCLFYHTDFLKLLDETWRMIGVPLDACGPVVKPLEIWIINKKCVLDYFTYEEIHNYLIPSSLYKKQEHEVDWRGRKFEPDRYENATSTRVINSVQKCREEYPFSFACTKLFGECGGLELCS